MRTIYVIAGIVLLGSFVSAEAQRVGDVVIVDQTSNNDEYVAGRSIRISTAIDGDLVVAGQEIVVDGSVAGDLIAAGDTLTVHQAIGDDARMAGRIVTIESSIAGHLIAAGDQVEIASTSTVNEWGWLAGRRITLNGRVTGELRAVGEEVFVSGDFDGDVFITAARVEIDSTSVIRGDLTIRSEDEPVIADGATVQGEIVREELPGGIRSVRGVTDSLSSSLAVIIAAVGLYLLFPGFSVSATNRVRSTPWRSLGIGMLVAILVPIAVIALFVTGIGFLVGLGTLAAYLLSLLLGYWFGLICVSGIGLRLIARPDRVNSRLTNCLAIGVSVIVLLFIRQIPILGGVLFVVIAVGGLGALMTELWLRYRLTPS